MPLHLLPQHQRWGGGGVQGRGWRSVDGALSLLETLTAGGAGRLDSWRRSSQ